MNIVLLISIFIFGFIMAICVDIILTNILNISISEFIWFCKFAIFYKPKGCIWLLKNKIDIHSFMNSDILNLDDDKFNEWLNIVSKRDKESWNKERREHKKKIFNLNDDQFNKWLNIVQENHKRFWEEERNKFKSVNC